VITGRSPFHSKYVGGHYLVLLPAFGGSKKIGSLQFFAICLLDKNRQILNQKLIIDFQIPWNSLCKTTAEARRAEAYNINKNYINSIWWCLLNDVRTFFQQNPNTD